MRCESERVAGMTRVTKVAREWKKIKGEELKKARKQSGDKGFLEWDWFANGGGGLRPKFRRAFPSMKNAGCRALKNTVPKSAAF